MFSALGAGSGTGGVGLRSSPISHLSETMRALLDTSPVKAAQAAYFSRSEQRGAREKPRRDWDTRGSAASLALCFLPLPGTCPPPHFTNLSLFLEIKNKQTIQQ